MAMKASVRTSASLPETAQAAKDQTVAASSAGQDNSMDRADRDEGISGVPDGDAGDTSDVPELRHLLRAAIDASSWRGKHEALSVEMQLPDRFYLSKMLGGTKPIGARHLMALPKDVGCRFAQLHAEAHGFIVVEPACGPDAVKQFVSGLFGVLNARTVPLRMARAAVGDVKTRRLG
jgi:hypothetical protein